MTNTRCHFGPDWWHQWSQLSKEVYWCHSSMMLLVIMLKSKVSVFMEVLPDVWDLWDSGVFCEVHDHSDAQGHNEVSVVCCYRRCIGCLWLPETWSYSDASAPAVTSNHYGVHYSYYWLRPWWLLWSHLLLENYLNSNVHTDNWCHIECSEMTLENRLMAEILSVTGNSVDVPDKNM